LGRNKEAVQQYQLTLNLDPEMVEALNDLAWIFASSPDADLRNGQEAVRLAQHACELTQFKIPLMGGTTAAADAAAGQFPEAVRRAEQAADMASSLGRMEVARRNRALAELFRSHRAYHEPPVPGSLQKSDAQ